MFVLEITYYRNCDCKLNVNILHIIAKAITTCSIIILGISVIRMHQRKYPLAANVATTLNDNYNKMKNLLD